MAHNDNEDELDAHLREAVARHHSQHWPRVLAHNLGLVAAYARLVEKVKSTLSPSRSDR